MLGWQIGAKAMTKKDYELLADSINQSLTNLSYEYVDEHQSCLRNSFTKLVILLSKDLERDNSRFNPVKFKAACLDARKVRI